MEILVIMAQAPLEMSETAALLVTWAVNAAAAGISLLVGFSGVSVIRKAFGQVGYDDYSDDDFNQQWEELQQERRDRAADTAADFGSASYESDEEEIPFRDSWDDDDVAEVADGAWCGECQEYSLHGRICDNCGDVYKE